MSSDQGLSSLVFFKLKHTLEVPGRVVKIQIARPLPKVSDSVNLGWDPRIFISHSFPSDAGAFGPGAIL